MLRITAALLFLSPVLASAQCLTAADLDNGLTVEYGDGDLSYIERSETGNLVNAYYDLDSYSEFIYIFESHDGIFPVSRSGYIKGKWTKFSDVTNSYAFTPASTADLNIGATGYGSITESDFNYGDEDKKLAWSVYESDPLVVGDCSYDAVRVFTYITNIANGDIVITELKFLPQLGVALSVGGGFFNKSPEEGTVVSLTSG